MAEFEYQNSEAFNTVIRLAANIGRLKIVSNLKASSDAQTRAFEQAGMAAALVAEGSTREGPAQAALYRDARGALAQCRAWLHVLAVVTNEQDAVFATEFELAEQASRQVNAAIRAIERGTAGGPGRGSNVTPPRGGGGGSFARAGGPPPRGNDR